MSDEWFAPTLDRHPARRVMSGVLCPTSSWRCRARLRRSAHRCRCEDDECATTRQRCALVVGWPCLGVYRKRLPRGGENLIANVVERAGDQGARRSRVTAAAELPRERVD